MNTERTTSRKVRVGKVVSDKMDKTVVVIVEDRVAHKVYKKIKLQVTRKFGETGKESKKTHEVDVSLPFILNKPEIETKQTEIEDWSLALSVDTDFDGADSTNLKTMKYKVKATGAGQITWEVKGLPAGVTYTYSDSDVDSNDRYKRAESWLIFSECVYAEYWLDSYRIPLH